MIAAKKVMMGGGGVNPIVDVNNAAWEAIYSFDNLSGASVIDETPNARNATLINAPAIAAGHIGNAVTTDGVNQRVDINAIPEANIKCVTGWVRSDLTGTSAMADAGNTVTGANFCAVGFLASGKFFVNSNDNSGPLGDFFKTTNATFAANTFHHYTIQEAADGLSLEFLINDVLQAATVVTGVDVGQFFSDFTTDTFNVGARIATVNTFRIGDYDNMRFGNRSLTAEENTALYNGGAGV